MLAGQRIASTVQQRHYARMADVQSSTTRCLDHTAQGDVLSQLIMDRTSQAQLLAAHDYLHMLWTRANLSIQDGRGQCTAFLRPLSQLQYMAASRSSSMQAIGQSDAPNLWLTAACGTSLHIFQNSLQPQNVGSTRSDAKRFANAMQVLRAVRHRGFHQLRPSKHGERILF